MAFGKKTDDKLEISVITTPEGKYIHTTDLTKMITDESGHRGPVPKYLESKRGLFLDEKLSVCRFIERFMYNSKKKKMNFENRRRLLSLLILGEVSQIDFSDQSPDMQISEPAE